LGIRLATSSDHCDRRRRRQAPGESSRSTNRRRGEVGGRLGDAACALKKHLLHIL
jgi:hypothetical protein